jgi:hypothetical protein
MASSSNRPKSQHRKQGVPGPDPLPNLLLNGLLILSFDFPDNPLKMMGTQSLLAINNLLECQHEQATMRQKLLRLAGITLLVRNRPAIPCGGCDAS